VSHGSVLSAPRIREQLLQLDRLVVVDPRRTETAALASQHVPIRPGTDALLLLALLHTIFAEGLARPGRLAGFTDGLDAVAAAAAEFTPERVAASTGVGPEEVRALARAFAAAPSAVAYGRVGVSTQPFGGLCQWLLVVLNVVTGNLDREGGAMFALPAADLLPFARRAGLQGSFGRWRSRVRGLPEFGGELPAAALAEEMDTPGPGQVRGLITVASNPALSVPNGVRLRRALAGLEFMVSVDFYLNETTRHAHVVLPPTSALERDHYDAAFHLLAVRNTAKYSPPVFPRAPDARDDWEILLELGAGLQARRGHRLLATALRRGVGALGPTGLVAWLLRTGPYGPGLIPFARGLTLARLRDAPHGVDLGPLRPCLPGRLPAGWTRIRLAPAPFIEDVERLRRSLDGAASGLVLVGRRDLRSNNSWMHNSERLTRGKDRCTLLMHPGDAAARGLADGARVQVRSRVGDVEVALEVTDAMRPGVVCLPHGYG
ncbi:MAG TPA: molybdopterin dinucleotide binding domain-containing protein, partial [Vicinamibacteria bacterium]|nr:molybdopterin dinucleotide binding domain-containing protein [Vicinamibacteria bacterium]